MDQEYRRNKPDKEHSERTGLNNGRLRREENSTRRRAYSEEYTITVQPVNKKHLHSTTTIQLHLTAADYQRIRQDLASEFFLNKTTRIYARGLRTKDKRQRVQETQDYNDDDASRLFIRLLF